MIERVDTNIQLNQENQQSQITFESIYETGKRTKVAIGSIDTNTSSYIMWCIIGCSVVSAVLIIMAATASY